jgi:exopolyphosphatase/guanosine-5'-triphosphate,3'-diphosphate pyrophosphatase
MSKKVVAAIDLGSHALRMKVGEISKSGLFYELENYRKINGVGHDTFTTGKVSFNTVDKICDELKLFKKSFEEYGVDQYMAMATSAIREAENRDYIVDQIRLKTGLEIEVISNSEEQYLTHKAIKHKLKNYEQLIQEGAVVVVVGAGSVQITTYKEGRLRSSQNVKMGSLRIKEVFDDIERKTLRYHNILDEYITTNLEGVDFFKEADTYEHLIAVGGEISVISKIIENQQNKDRDQLSEKEFIKLFDHIVDMTIEEIEETYGVKRERAEIILPSMMLFKMFLEKVKSNQIITPIISLTDGIIRLIHEEMYLKKRSNENDDDIIANAESLARKFQHNSSHAKQVEENALVLFDRLKKIHGLKHERVLLQVASILHDVGKIIALDQHHKHSYNIIRSLEIFGLSEEHVEMVANIACYHSMVKPTITDENFKSLPREARTKVGKLISILRLADALDRSHKGKIQIQSVRLHEKELIIHCTSAVNADTTLEEWTFNQKADYFMEVFGITPRLKIKREFENEKK